MRTKILIMLTLPSLVLANPWYISGGAGFGQHESNNEGAGFNTQTQWHIITSVSSALYEGMDGRLSYDHTQGLYAQDLLADDNLSIDFRAHLVQSNLRIGAGLGLGFNHRKDITLDTNLNQAYVPFYFDIQTMKGTFRPWRFSVQSDYFVHPPNENFINGFNPLLSRLETGIHYHYKQFEYSTTFQLAKFSNESGMHGINTKRIEGQIAYHWSPQQ